MQLEGDGPSDFHSGKVFTHSKLLHCSDLEEAAALPQLLNNNLKPQFPVFFFKEMVFGADLISHTVSSELDELFSAFDLALS